MQPSSWLAHSMDSHDRGLLSQPTTVKDSEVLMIPTPEDVQKWLLTFSSNDPSAPNGDGRPWGDGTEIGCRASKGLSPWDLGCQVTPMIGGYRAMSEIRDTLQGVIDEFPPEDPPSQRDVINGHVYIAGWRLNPLRDLSATNPWKTASWAGSNGVARSTAPSDETALGMFLKLMQSRIQLRMLVWCPLATATLNGMGPHIEDHMALMYAVNDASAFWTKMLGLSSPIAIVGLDSRVTSTTADVAAHHQKMMVVRAGSINVAFCGGVDLAYTRRDAPNDP